MKGIFKLAVYGIAIIAAFASCSNNDDVPSQSDIESNIIGKWKKVEINGQAVLTNDRVVRTFSADNNETLSSSHHYGSVYVW